MSPQTLRLLVAAAIALGIALPFATPEIAGVATWKIVLDILGLFMFIAGGRKGSHTRREGGTN